MKVKTSPTNLADYIVVVAVVVSIVIFFQWIAPSILG